ncbi:pilus assembly protein CpaE [Arcanobacterium wilhelmae]|uniref:Pilus assembly protein CpaE n=1 Tax=Arcanobacterium wilhelmae TaxID=1803177 RepID=A0ABT9NBI3_9ACTO|nr:AAA family ATPase [Arcanobacterium wilhelmae]MDP9800883.1 pilus assembly protein CpaE [Arcanobacterium wilhelmae]WFN90250.1 AAA family ATPase [Arcanobacterium wilhelmae]
MYKAIIAVTDTHVESDLRGMLSEIASVGIAGMAKTPGELRDYSQRFQPDLLFVPEIFGSAPSLPLVKELAIRHPATAIIVLSQDRTETALVKALEAGAKSVVSFPIGYEDFRYKVNTALDWSSQMREVIHGATETSARSRGRILTLTGAKGGVGTTTLATHIVTSIINDYPNLSVCLVDLDLEKGDVSSALDVKHTTSIADLAIVYKDLSSATVLDAVIDHESGAHLLLAPSDVRQTELISPEAIRTILALLRQEFDVIVVDAGGYVSPAQATAIEVGDVVATVTTADVLSIRTMKKRVFAWENLGVCQERELKVIVNKTDRGSSFPVESVEKLTSAAVLAQRIPLSARTIEPALVSRDPHAVTDTNWWKLIANIRNSLFDTHLRTLSLSASGHARTDGLPDAGTPVAFNTNRQPRRRWLSRVQNQTSESGAISLEFAGVFTVFLMLLAVLWQGVVAGVSHLWLAQAATESTREYAISQSVGRAEAAARNTMPTAFADHLSVTQLGAGAHGQKLKIQINLPRSMSFIQTFSTERDVVTE